MSEEDSEVTDDVDLDRECKLCSTGQPHPVYLYLISDRVASGGEYSYIGRSRHPTERLKSQNRESGYRVGAKSTKHRAGFLALEMVIGPITVHKTTTILETAKKLQLEWRSIGRKLNRRLQMGYQIGLKYNMEMYAADKMFVAQTVMSLEEEEEEGEEEEETNESCSPFNGANISDEDGIDREHI